MFLDGSETFISAMCASRVKIRALNYGADPEILTSGLHYPYFDHFSIFKKNKILGNRSKIIFKLDDSSFLPGFDRIGTSSDRSEIFSKKY